MKIKQEKLDKFIKDRKNIPICLFCGNNSWNMSSTIFQLPEFDTNGFNLGGPTYPVVPITCDQCGNTLFINAIVAGLLEPLAPKSSGEEV